VSLVSRILKANPSIQVSDVLAGTFTLPSAKGVFVPPPAARGLFAGGYNGARINNIEYITIDTAGAATDFGDLTARRDSLGAVGSETRAMFAGGDSRNDGYNEYANVIDYVTTSTTGNALDFGDLTAGRRYCGGGVNNATRGVFASGDTGAENTNIIDYITMATIGNATDFGDLTVGRAGAVGLSSTTRGVFCGGQSSNVMDYITIATTGNATDFGDISASQPMPGTVASNTRGVIAGFGDNRIDYLTIATTGNTSDFGDLTVGRDSCGGASSQIRGVFGDGYVSGFNSTSEYITIATTGNGTSFGNLTIARYATTGTSNANGGLTR
jgi:hypothetical protein